MKRKVQNEHEPTIKTSSGARQSRDTLIRRLAEAGHKQKDIAQAVGLDKSVVSRIVKGGLQNATERNINSTSAAEEMARLPKEKSLPMQEAPSPCGEK